ncbi:hypothetical protein K440DRAFT_663507 [Wilcoxina mikolae CBS 423.85]|nr:hypothetical protein K440DRAFT_663507 [Wilcoxina mikolae CBS 423.85]
MQLHPRSTDCPTNQQFYICSSPAFSGCCTSDPCLNSGTCPDSSSSITTQTPKTISANNNRLTRDPTLWILPPATATATPTPTTATTSAAAKTGMLVGGIIGGVAIVVAAVGLWYLFWLGRRGRGKGMGGKGKKESDEVPLKPTHTRSSSAGGGSVYSMAASAYDPIPSGDEGWKSIPSPPPPPLAYTPQGWEGGQWGEVEQQQQYAELPTAMMEPVELGASEAETPGTPVPVPRR